MRYYYYEGFNLFYRRYENDIVEVYMPELNRWIRSSFNISLLDTSMFKLIYSNSV